MASHTLTSIVKAVFTESERSIICDALSDKTVEMRRHVRNMDRELDMPNLPICYADTIGARRYLSECESLLDWAKNA